MPLTDLLAPQAVVPALRVNSKKQALQELAARAAAMIKKVGAEHLIVSTDCGQTGNVFPTDCLVLAARRLRAFGVTQRELDLMYKVNPAKLLGLSPPAESAVARQ